MAKASYLLHMPDGPAGTNNWKELPDPDGERKSRRRIERSNEYQKDQKTVSRLIFLFN